MVAVDGGGILAGRAVVITGAGRGIGAAYARLAAAEGAAVVVADVDDGPAAEVAAGIRATGGRALEAAVDVTSWSAAEALVDRCVAEFGAIDGLVNNAGVMSLATLEEEDEAYFRRHIEVNLLGVAFCGSVALKRMAAQGHGSLVNITSGAQSGFAGQTAYGASKGGVSSLTYAWAAAVAGTGVRVNAVSPNAQTRMSRTYDVFVERRGGVGQGPAQNTDTKPPELNAPAVVYLLSDRAAGVNGQVVRIDGRELALGTHPGVLEPTLHRDEWTVGAIADAFDSDLAARQQPIGIGRVRHSAS